MIAIVKMILKKIQFCEMLAYYGKNLIFIIYIYYNT